MPLLDEIRDAHNVVAIEVRTVSTLTWLHISDLHWRESQAYGANIVVEALLHDLANRAEIASELECIDFIFITGDIAFASQPEEYGLAHSFFDDLCRTTGVRKERLFFVPGNHDVDRNALSDEAHEIVNGLANHQMVNRLLDDDVNRAIVMQRFRCYKQFVNGYLRRYPPFDSGRYFYVETCQCAGKRIAILGLNSAWTSASDDDRLKLLLGERQVRTALDQAQHADVRIALMHHPFEWLQDFDRDDCEPLLLRGCDFVLHGHLHRTGLIQLRAPGIEAMVIAAGACYETRQYLNSYNLVQLDLRAGKGTVYLQTYSDRHGGFWTRDLLTYPEAPGEYHFDLPRRWIIAEIPRPRRSPLDKWWQQRGYTGDPFIASNAEDADTGQLRDWHIDCLSLADRRRRGIDTLAAVIREGDSRLGLIYAPTGGGKTFYRRLATQWCREEINSRGALEISATDLHRARVYSRDGLSAHRLAVCVRDKILVHHPQRSPLVDISSGVGDDPGYVLSQCATLAASFNPERGPVKLYIFLDDLDKIYHKLSKDKHRAALEAMVDFLVNVAGNACGEFVAMRVFLPLELYEPIQQALPSHLHGRIWQEELLWTLESCEEVAERRFEISWDDGTRRGHLGFFLHLDAQVTFRRMLRKRERLGTLSPRDVIETLSAVASYAANKDIKDQLISEERYRESQATRKARRWTRLLRKLWPWAFALSVLAFLLWYYPQIRAYLTTFPSLPARAIRSVIQWLTNVLDWVEAFLLLVAVLGASVFVFWCLLTSYQSGQQLDWHKCLQQAWQFIHRHIPGGS